MSGGEKRFTFTFPTPLVCEALSRQPPALLSSDFHLLAVTLLEGRC